jgi:hypothetical protein
MLSGIKWPIATILCIIAPNFLDKRKKEMIYFKGNNTNGFRIIIGKARAEKGISVYRGGVR